MTLGREGNRNVQASQGSDVGSIPIGANIRIQRTYPRKPLTVTTHCCHICVFLYSSETYGGIDWSPDGKTITLSLRLAPPVRVTANIDGPGNYLNP